MTIEELKALESRLEHKIWPARIEGPLVAGSFRVPWITIPTKDYDFVMILRNLAPELIALWEACNEMDSTWRASAFVARKKALDDLNAKAKEIQL